jgi:hypothetical protein
MCYNCIMVKKLYVSHTGDSENGADTLFNINNYVLGESQIIIKKVDTNKYQNVHREVYNNMINKKLYNNTESIKNKIFICDCGLSVKLIDKLKHLRNVKHIDFIRNNIKNKTR